jgi:3-hydroxy acid dehydrogenase/malonic semialdehyde reductase
MTLKEKSYLITGASSGIGKAIALRLASKAHTLKLIARRKDKLDLLYNDLMKINPELKIDLIVQDINDPHFISFLKDHRHLDVGTLISNAGIAVGKDYVENANWDDLEKMIQTNFLSLVKLTHAVLPVMKKNGFGDILHVSSISGHQTYVGGAVYAATKHAVHAFTKALREETCGQNIRVMQISPGMVETEFSLNRFNQDEQKARQVYEGMTPLKAEDIARHVDFMLSEPRHVTIDELTTTPIDQGSVNTVRRL